MPSFRLTIAAMRLFKRRHRSGLEVWFIEIRRGQRYSTGCLVGQDDAEAEALFNKVKKDAQKGKLARLYDEDSPLLLTEFAREYLEHGRRLSKSPHSLRKDEQALRYFVTFAGSQVRLADITRRLVESWLVQLPMKPVSRNTYFRHFKAALGKAVDWDYLKRNPCRGIKQLRDDELPPRALAPEEIGRLLGLSGQGIDHPVVGEIDVVGTPIGGIGNHVVAFDAGVIRRQQHGGRQQKNQK